jgi:predicted cupin superfamily sugar epimerase
MNTLYTSEKTNEIDVKDAQYWIRKLNLTRHPEGGYYKETFRAKEFIKAEHLPQRYNGNRCFSTSIYFLLESHEISALHRIKSNEIWHFYSGSSLTLYRIDPEGMLFKMKLGNDLNNGELFQVHIKAGNWFGATVNERDSYSLVGCTVSPGFEFEDFEIGERRQLIRLFPRHKEIIQKLTKE